MENKNLITKYSGKNVKPFFSDKSVNSSKTSLLEKNSIVVDENKFAHIMNNFLSILIKLSITI